MAYRSPYAALHGELDELLQATREKRRPDPANAVQQTAFYRDLEERWARARANEPVADSDEIR